MVRSRNPDRVCDVVHYQGRGQKGAEAVMDFTFYAIILSMLIVVSLWGYK